MLPEPVDREHPEREQEPPAQLRNPEDVLDRIDECHPNPPRRPVGLSAAILLARLDVLAGLAETASIANYAKPQIHEGLRIFVAAINARLAI